MGEHPTVAEIRSFTQGVYRLEMARELVAHLLRGCPFCREETARQSRMGKSAAAAVSYDAAFERPVVHKLPMTGRAAGGRRAEDLPARAASPLLQG
ncbi:MAG TPA: hypothetical protein VIA62_12610 [Thermoanaerobaculia bacterium]|jgi:hypothetical protein|nr:hypothetical protein [Thermoanaerobaculia bacterium]